VVHSGWLVGSLNRIAYAIGTSCTPAFALNLGPAPLLETGTLSRVFDLRIIGCGGSELQYSSESAPSADQAKALRTLRTQIADVVHVCDHLKLQLGDMRTFKLQWLSYRPTVSSYFPGMKIVETFQLPRRLLGLLGLLYEEYMINLVFFC
jgi:hypothetical protein